MLVIAIGPIAITNNSIGTEKTANFGSLIYYIILAPLILVFLLAGLSNTLK